MRKSIALLIAIAIANVSPGQSYAQSIARSPGANGAATRCYSGALPSGHLFAPLRADPHVAQLSGALGFMDTDKGLVTADDPILVGIASLGGVVGLYRQSDRECNGVQIGLAAVAVSLFELDSSFSQLLDIDYRVSVPIELRRGLFSARLRIAHQSTHLGDGLLAADEEIVREVVGYEWIDLAVAARGEQGRIYAGGGVVVHADPEFGRKMVFAGFELARSSPGLSPMLAAHWQTVGEQDWSGTLRIQAGVSLHAAGRPGNRIDLVVAYTRGASPYSQFFVTDSLEIMALELRAGF